MYTYNLFATLVHYDYNHIYYTSLSIILVCVNYVKCLHDSPSLIKQVELVCALTVNHIINTD